MLLRLMRASLKLSRDEAEWYLDECSDRGRHAEQQLSSRYIIVGEQDGFLEKYAEIFR